MSRSVWELNKFLFVIPSLLVLIFGINHAYADVIITNAQGSGAPGCEENARCYLPSTASATVGEKVIMKNTDTAAHTFTSGHPGDGPDGKFDTGLIMAHNSFEWMPKELLKLVMSYLLMGC